MSRARIRSAAMRAAVLAILLPLPVVAYLSYSSLVEQRETQRVVRHTLEVLSCAHELDGHLGRLQLHLKDYVLFAEPGVRRSGEQAFAALLDTVRRLEPLVRDDPSQAARLRSIVSAVEEWRAGVEARAIAAVEAGRQPTAVALARESRNDLLAARDRVGRLIRIEEDRLRNRRQVNDAAYEQARLVVIQGALLVLAIGIALFFFLERARRRGEAALAESEARTRAIVDHTVDGIVTIDERGVIVAFNPAAERIFGWPAAEILGRNVSHLMPSPRREQHDGFIARYLRTRVTHVIGKVSEATACRRDGSLFAAELSVGEVRLEHGRLFTGIVRDISERKRAEAALAKVTAELQAVLDSATQAAIIATDPGGVIRIWNPGAERMLGFGAAEMVGVQTPLRFHLATEVETYGQALSAEVGRPIGGFEVFVERARHGGYDEREWICIRKDGGRLTVRLAVTALRDAQGGVTGFLWVATDISAHKAVERMKDEFVSMVSHELRTPLTSIRGALGLLAGGVGGTLPAQGQRMLEVAVANTDRLVRLINDILDIARMESGRVGLARQYCLAGELMTQAGEVMQPMADAAGVRLEVAPAPIRLWADPDRLLQTLTNLLSNAIKFSARGGRVRLTATRDEGEATFQVADEGRGIPADKLQVIFERFQQVDASDAREQGGTGLGLAICRSIVEQHGGRIWAESVPGQGSTFAFTLPTSRSAAAAGEVPAPPLALVCDDDPADREASTALLVRLGYRVVAVAAGGEAVERAAAERPAVILMDLHMREMDGWAAIGLLRDRPETRAIPLVIASVEPPGGRRLRASDGIADWLVKPLTEAALAQALDRARRPGPAPARVLLAEDDAALADELDARLRGRGLLVSRSATGETAIRLGQQVGPDLLILDIDLPDGDGFEVVEWMRRHDRLRQVPVLVYTALTLSPGERERLRLGPTVVLAKAEASPAEVEARALAMLGRGDGPPDGGQIDDAR